MSFERGKDPVDSMGIGRKKNARPLVKIEYMRDGKTTQVGDPKLLKAFIERFSELDIPNDPLFGIQKIVLVSTEKYTDNIHHLLSSFSGGSGGCESVERDRDVNIEIADFAGKDFIYEDKIYPMPTLEEIEVMGFGHLMETSRKTQETWAASIAKTQNQLANWSANLSAYNSHTADLVSAQGKSQIELIKAQMGMDDEDIKKNEEALIKERKSWLKFLPNQISIKPKAYWIDIETMP